MKRTTVEAKQIHWVGAKPSRAVPHAMAYQAAGGLTCFVAREAGKWHISMSAKGRYPSWDELASAKERFVPDDVTMAMILPPRDQYVNLHATTLHLFEIDGDQS